MTQTQMGVAFALVLITGMGWYSKISDQQRQVKRYQQEVAEAADFEKRGLYQKAGENYKEALGIKKEEAIYEKMMDAYTMKIPNLCTIVLLVGRILFMIPELLFYKGDFPMLLVNSFIPAFIALILLCLLYKISRSGLGMGDIKIFTGLAFFTGMYGFCVSLLFSFLLCALCSLPVLLLKKKKLKDALPLGPFIYFGFGFAAMLSLI